MQIYSFLVFWFANLHHSLVNRTWNGKSINPILSFKSFTSIFIKSTIHQIKQFFRPLTFFAFFFDHQLPPKKPKSLCGSSPPYSFYGDGDFQAKRNWKVINYVPGTQYENVRKH
jgi:hypothetical protein